MKRISNYLLATFLLIVFLSFSNSLFAPPFNPPPPPDVPLDGGLTLLIGGAVVYVGNEIRAFMKKKKAN